MFVIGGAVGAGVHCISGICAVVDIVVAVVVVVVFDIVTAIDN